MKLVSMLFAFVLAALASLVASVQTHYKKAVAAVVVGAPMLSMAQVTATDIAPVVTGITAAIALIVLIGNAKLLVRLAIRTYSWIAGAMR